MTNIVQNGVLIGLIEVITRDRVIANKMSRQVEKQTLCICESHKRGPYMLKKTFIYST